MKTITTFLLCAFCILTGVAQTDSNGSRMNIPKRTPELQALYQQAKQLENNGTAAEINANRLAIKAAWQQVDPAIAQLYKPIENTGSGLNMTEREITPEDAQPISRSPEDWNTDLLLREGFIDGLDMDATADGDIYIAAFENYMGSSGDDSALYIYRSLDGGNSFALWNSLNLTSVFFSKIQTISMDGNGENYLLVYILGSNGIFQTLRYNMANGDFEIGPYIATDVADFSVDSNYVTDTSSRRVFATYAKPDFNGDLTIHAARSTAGSYGFDWVDEVDAHYYTDQLAFAYGHNGACYATLINIAGGNGNLVALVNPDNGDPATWDTLTPEQVTDGTITETKDPTIRAARNSSVNTDNVLILASSRAAGSTDHFNGKAYKRENGSAFGAIPFITTNTDNNIVHIDSWIRRVNDVETIQTSMALERIDGSENNKNFSLTYNGYDFDVSTASIVSDPNIDVFQGFSSAIAETSDGLPCMAFAGTSTAVNNGYNLYFDAKTELLRVDANQIKEIKVYPNPAHDIIKLSAKNTIKKVEIFSMLGQQVMQLSPEQKSPSINLSSLAIGVYVMKVEVDGQIGTYKIIKE